MKFGGHNNHINQPESIHNLTKEPSKLPEAWLSPTLAVTEYFDLFGIIL